MKGKVTIAGAGPGELEHLTIAALRAIHSADVILYDALIGDSIKAEFPATAETIFVGKRCGNHAYTQTMIVAAMIEHALAGRHVLRLKGGDPAIFAHLSAELEALQKLGIETRILPGVTAMLTAAADLGRPLTTRGNNRHIWVTDGHSEDIKKYAGKMAAFPGTLVFYMGAGRAREIAQLLMENGIEKNKPCVLVENAGSNQRHVSRGTVADAAVGAITRSTHGPGILLLGDALAADTAAVEAEYAAATQL
ncbi:MAG: uroporphyrinogen-III C-methyltransferase [Spirochaetota bacterium]